MLTAEEILKRQRIEDELGFKLAKPVGWDILIKLFSTDKETNFIKDDGTESAIIKPEESIRFDSFATCVGLVCDKGPAAYKSDAGKFKYSGSYCKVGDWVIFTLGEGFQFEINKTPFLLIYDDRIRGIVEDPKSVTRRR